MTIIERWRRWRNADGPAPRVEGGVAVFDTVSAAAMARPVWSAADYKFEAELKRRLGPLCRGFTGNGYANRYGGGFVPRPGSQRPTTYVLHHTAGAPAWTGGDVWRFHVQSRGWDTVGYAVLVSPSGAAELLVPPSMMTYGAGKANPYSVHVSCHGNYVSTAPPPAMLATVYQVFLALDACYGDHEWRGHKELPAAATACPGGLLPHLQAMRGARYGAATPPKQAYP